MELEPSSPPSLPEAVPPEHDAAWIDRIDPRARVCAAVAFSGLIAVAGRPAVLGMAIGMACLSLCWARLRLRDVLKRLAPLNLLMLVLGVLLPLSTPGESMVTLVHFSAEGFWHAVIIALRGNAIVLALILLIGTLEIATLGHALAHLWVPKKLIHLLLFTVRYLDVLGREYLRLAAAMKMRAFRPRMSRHTYRTYGYLVGMLLVRSLDRAERIVAAMKCRGFRGRFYLLDHFRFSIRDAWFATMMSVILCGLAWIEWR